MSIFLKSQRIIKDWIDYNGHMNVAYYVLIFDEASEGMLDKFKMGGIDAKQIIEVQWSLSHELRIIMK